MLILGCTRAYWVEHPEWYNRNKHTIGTHSLEGMGNKWKGMYADLFIFIFFMWKQAGDHRLVDIRVWIMAR